MCDYLYLYCGDQTDLGQAACVTIFISIVVIRQIWDRLAACDQTDYLDYLYLYCGDQTDLGQAACVTIFISGILCDYLYLYCGDQTDLGQAACVTIFISIVVIRQIWDRLHV